MSTVKKFVTLLLVCLSASCSENNDQQTASTEAADLTGPDAKAALLVLIRSKTVDAFEGLEADRLAAIEPSSTDLGTSWGPFALDLAERKYRFVVGRNLEQPTRIERTEYQGDFTWETDHWIAWPPEIQNRSVSSGQPSK